MEIATTLGTLQAELEQANAKLKGVDETIKRFMGRDPNEPLPTQPATGGPRRVVSLGGRQEAPFRNVHPPGRFRNAGGNDADDGPPANKRRSVGGSVFSRLSGVPLRSKRNVDVEEEEDERPSNRALQSKVIPSKEMLVTREDVLTAQSKDEKSKARNRRMFGALLGTLQKFQKEETLLKDKEEKKAIVEKKLEENARLEKEQMRKDKQELFADRRAKQIEVKKIEQKVNRIKSQEEWEKQEKHLMNFIRTSAKPPIFYCPKVHTPETLKLLEASKEFVEKRIETKRAQLQEDLEYFEQHGKWKPPVRPKREERREQRRIGRKRSRSRSRDKKSKDHKKSQLAVDRPTAKEMDSDLEREAGPELDDDAVTGKEGDEGERGGERSMHKSRDVYEPPPPGTEVNGDFDGGQGDEEVKPENTSMQVEEFEPLYD
ncbi:pinin isoform X2 [Neocloeon triangulifer]|uniref:pinin isoform X2 n=1 Tax=Neocloeon triangulifer TaxID=2078957 RepID=UPI00286EFAE2|nr:pinin isoform X2 [Neocloeon triangulifer]